MCAIMDHDEKEDLSTSTFQQKIFDWFDRRGMLSELRSHLRHQMITAFQNSSMGNPNPTGRFSVDTPISPALQALLLLVAEFLVEQEYNYTVSILVAEVPLLATFPKFSAHVSHLSESQLSLTNRTLPRFSEKDVLEVLETLGIESDSEGSHHIVRLYLNSTPRESLLACILTALPAVANGLPDSSGIEPRKHPENLAYFIEEIRLLLLRAQLDKNQLRQLEDILRRLHAKAAAKAREEERAVCLKEAETNNQQLRIWENAARQRQRDAEVELETNKRHLKSVAAQLRVQHDDVLRRLRRVQKHAEEVRAKEEKVEAAKYNNEQLRKHLDARSEQLVAQEARLEDGFRSLQAMRAEIQNASQREETYLSSINEQKEICAKLKSELEKTMLELNEVRKELKASTQTKIQYAVEPSRGAEKEVASRFTQTEVQGSSSSSSSVAEPAASSSCSEVDPQQIKSISKKGDGPSGLASFNVVRHLRQENAELQERNVQLQRRLEEVTEQAAMWAASPSRIVEPSVGPRPPIPPPPPPLPPPPQIRRVARSCELGAGEELGHPPVRQAASSRDHTLHLHGREWKRSPPKQLLMHVEASEYPSSDESVSEEVLRETGRRLRHLDTESQLIDRRRKELKESALTSTASYMFIPTATTPTLPPPPAARPYEPGSMASRLSLFPPEKISNSLNFGLHDSTLGRYSQVTWPDVQGMSTPILDSPLRRGVRSHLSLSRDRRNTQRNSEERVSTSPLRSTERNAFLRLDTALDNIKLAREDLNAKPTEETKTADESKDRSTLWDSVRSVQNEDTSVFRPDPEFESPAHLRDRVMATLRASTPLISGLFTMPSPAPVASFAPTSASTPAPTFTSAPAPTCALTPAPTFASTSVPVSTASASTFAPTPTRAPVPETVSIERETIEMPSEVPEQEKPVVDMSLPYRISSTKMPELPLAPPVIAEDSPKDSTLNEISTPTSSPSMGKQQNILSKTQLEDVNPKRNFDSKQQTDKEKSVEDLAEKPEKSQNSGSVGKHPESLGKATPLKLDARSQPTAVTTNTSQHFFLTDAEFCGNDDFQPSNVLKEAGGILEEASLSSINSQISAGPADDILKDDSW